MNQSFMGFNISITGLFTAQKNLMVTGHNINNINTPGYSRQVAVQTAGKPLVLNNSLGMLGTGSDITGIKRIRDEYLDYKYWSQSTEYGEWTAKKEVLSEIEAVFGEPSDSGFVKIQTDFFNALQDLTKDPDNLAIRELLRQRANTFTTYFSSCAERLEKLQGDLNYRINLKVKEINSLAVQIHDLNSQIFRLELEGGVANDLRDRRGVLIDNLSKIVNVGVNEIVIGKKPDGTDQMNLSITIGGKVLVDHYGIAQLSVSQRKDALNQEDITGLYDVAWEDGNTLNLRGGELKALVDMRDGNASNNDSPPYKGVPFYIGKLNEFVRNFAMAFNEGMIDLDGDGIIDDGPGHVDGYRPNSNAGDMPSGIRFFTIKGGDNNPITSQDFAQLDGEDMQDKYLNMTAKNFTLSFEVLDDLNNISLSGTAGETGNIEVLNSLIELRHNANMFKDGKPEDFMQSIVASMGIDSQQAVLRSENQESIIKQLDNRRLSESGVSIDEEMANLVKFQHSYNASAKMMQTMQEIYERLVDGIFR